MVKHCRKTIHLAGEKRADRFWGYIPRRKTRTARRENDINARIRHPARHRFADCADLILYNLAGDDCVTGRTCTRDQQATRSVRRLVARVRDRHHGKVKRVEFQCFINSGFGHDSISFGRVDLFGWARSSGIQTPPLRVSRIRHQS